MANSSEREASPLKRADTIRLTVEEWEACAKRLGCTSIPKPQRIISSFHRRSSLWSRDNYDSAQERVKGTYCWVIPPEALHDMEKLAGKEEPQAISPFQELSH